MEVSSQETPSDDFGFAFNQVRFSDSVLRIEIVPDSSGSRAEPDVSLVLQSGNRKRQRDDQITTDDSHGTAGQEPETSSGMEVKTVHVSAPILAAKSPFFYKLFSNATRDSEQRQFTLRIHASEEDALMDLLNFMYCNTLHSTTPTALLNVLMAADKFAVSSCAKYCSQLLQNIPMSCESALVYLDLPSKIRMADTVQPLADAAKKYLVTRFKDIKKCREEVLNLPLSGFEAVLSSDDLQVDSEDVLYNLVLKWAKKHYPKLEDRREILSTRLLRYVRFPYMSCRLLKDVLIEPSLASEAVRNALFCKAQSPYSDRSLGSPSNPPPSRALQSSNRHVNSSASATSTSSARSSEPFDIGGRRFDLSGYCSADRRQGEDFSCFGLFLRMVEEGSAPLTIIACGFASRVKPSEEFASLQVYAEGVKGITTCLMCLGLSS